MKTKDTTKLEFIKFSEWFRKNNLSVINKTDEEIVNQYYKDTDILPYGMRIVRGVSTRNFKLELILAIGAFVSGVIIVIIFSDNITYYFNKFIDFIKNVIWK